MGRKGTVEENGMLKGWKTYIAAAVVVIAAGLQATGHEGIGSIVLTIGGALGLVGLRDAMPKKDK